MRGLALLLTGAFACLAGDVRSRMSELIDKREIPGAVTLTATPEKITHLKAVGFADPTGKTPMRADAIFWIASMTKPITASAVMMLQDEGKLSIEDPASKYIPELPAKITLRHMLTHTSGMGEPTEEEAKAALTLADLVQPIASKPMDFEPGSKWKYCQSGINMLGRIVEVVSGMPFPDFLAKRLFQPLGMKDTTFYLTAKQRKRYVVPVKLQNGDFVETTIKLLNGSSPENRRRYPAANGGLFSTASDYGRFARMILNDGTLDGKRYVSAEAVKLMTTVQTGDLKTGFTPGNGWGLGWCIVREPQGVTERLSPGTFGHGGAYGTQAWIDPVKRLALILMVQRADFPNSDASEPRRIFQEAVLQ